MRESKDGWCKLLKTNVRLNQKCLSLKPTVVGTRHARLDSLDTENPDHLKIISEKINLNPIRPEIIRIIGESEKVLKSKDVFKLLLGKMPQLSRYQFDYNRWYLSSLGILSQMKESQCCLSDLGKTISNQLKNNVGKDLIVQLSDTVK